MPKVHSHVPDKKTARTYSGEAIGRVVLGWLNFHCFPEHVLRQFTAISGERFNFREPQNRIIEMLRLYHQSRIDWENLIREPSKRITIKNSPPRKQSASQKLDRRLRRYTFFPRFFPAGKTLSFAWTSTRPDHPERYEEVSAIADLAKLAEQDLLGHLRECSCGKWIWARFSHQRFCSARCREREFRSSENWKEHRRQKAREYYRLHRSGKVK